MSGGALGKVFKNGEVIVQQGEAGDCMYVIQQGEVEVVHQAGTEQQQLAVLGEGDFFGEMAIFDQAQRSATVRALGDVRLLTVDKTTFLRRITEDPSLALRVVQKMSHRIRELNAELARLMERLGG
jgi:CRP/FNR family transcriptional regulator